VPKYGIHHIVLQEAVSELYASGNNAASDAAEVIKAEAPSAIIGSIGPDLFFWGPDYEVAEKFYKLYESIKEVAELLDKVSQPIREIMDAVVEPVEDLVETLAPNTVRLIEDLLNEIKQTESAFRSAIGTQLFAGVMTGANLLTNAGGIGSLSHEFFQMFVPDLQNNEKEETWLWFDMLHYRRTGQFAQNLVKRAGSDRGKAFAFGYLSHIATDVTGHAFVNQIVGTPYRLNVQRHVTAENYQDSWSYDQYYGGESINQTLFARLGLPKSLPSDIGDLLHGAFIETYAGLDHPKTRLGGDGFYTRNQIDETYELFYQVMQLMGSMGVERPEEPFSGVADILADILDNFRPVPSQPSTPSMCSWEDIWAFGETRDSRRCYETFFGAMTNWLNYLGELVKWTLDTIRNLIDLLLAILLSLPVCVLLAILYGIQLLCYQTYRAALKVLAMSGFVTPEPDELDDSVARNLITLAQPCAINFEFPSRGKPFCNNLVCPVPEPEEPTTAAAFYARGIASTPERFISEEPFNEQALRMYALSANDPGQTRSLQHNSLSIGNSRDFTAWMIRHANDPQITGDIQNILYTAWNLDADRGYGYHTWRGEVPEAAPFSVVHEEYFTV